MTRTYTRTVTRNAREGKARLVDEKLVALYLARCAQRISDCRMENDVPIAELAAATGINAATLSRVMRGHSTNSGRWKHGPKLSTLVRIALALGLSPSEVMP